MNSIDVRKEFPGLADKTFLDAACVSLTPDRARRAISQFLDMAVVCSAVDASAHHIEMDMMRSEPIRQAAELLSASPKNIALVESTTHGLNIAANALPLQRGDNVLIADTEFLQVAIPWESKQQAMGVEVIPVRSANGQLEVKHFEAAMTDRTKVVCVSSVQWCSGNRLDMRALGELCRTRGVWLVVDAIQEIGAMRVDMREQYADFLIAGGHKWLNAPFGCGLMVVSERVLQELEPGSYGYLAMAEPEGGWAEYFRTPSISPYRRYEFERTAKKFEIAGTANYPGAVGLGASLSLINDVGIGAIEQRIRKLTDLLHDELSKTRARLTSSREPAARSGVTVFQYQASPAEDRALVEEILRQKIYISIRYTSNIGGIRISTHFYNDEDDVLRLVHTLKRIAG
ncbi:MAG TPA: aminotransferase class V-fold PLP-dependent enzyme [Polyangium sp.]|nr:aminotransferase class V-fold PLP-dependent enzyme [Polyangium sp.]